MQKPSNMSDADFKKHREASLAEGARRASVEKNPTDHALGLEDRIAALERGSKPPAKPAAAKKARR